MRDGRVHDALALVAAAGLPSRRVSVPPLPPNIEREFLHAISRERLTGLALTTISHGALVLPDAAVDDLVSRHDDQLALDLRLEQLLVDATSVLAGVGIGYRALKGPVLAHTVYADPALRSFGDVDLLVRSGQFDDAIRALRCLGFGRRFVEPRAGFDARFAKGACLERIDGLEVDLHRTLAPGAFGVRVAQYDFFAAPARPVELGGETISGVSPEDAFVHACFHAALGDYPPRFVPLRDVVECARAGIDDAAVIAMATAMRCEAVFQRAVSLVDSVLAVHLAGEVATWARAYELTAFDRWALRSYASARRSYSRQFAASFCALPGVRDRASYVAALAFPSKTYVRARERTYSARLARGIREIRDAAVR